MSVTRSTASSGSPARDAEHAARSRRRPRSRAGVSCAFSIRDAELRSRRSRTSSPGRPRALPRSAPKQRGGQRDLVEHHRLAGVLEHAPQHEHAHRPASGRAGARPRRRPCARRTSTSRLAGYSSSPSLRRMRRKRNIDVLLLGVRRDERALALAPHDEVVGGERVDRLAHGALRDAEARRRARSRCGIASPGFHSPASRPRSSSALICRYSGWNVGGARGGAGAGVRHRSAVAAVIAIVAATACLSHILYHSI